MVEERIHFEDEVVASATENGTLDSEPQPLRWTTDEFHRIGETGVFEGRHVELIEGEILQMSPMLSRHAAAVMLADEAVRAAFGNEFRVRTQLPLDIGQSTDPEPDVAVVRGTARDYAAAHPTTAVLIIEISDATLLYARGRKASLYARVGIADLWLVNLQNGQLEVFRAPHENAAAPFGWSYGESQIVAREASVAPLAAPAAKILVADLLP